MAVRLLAAGSVVGALAFTSAGVATASRGDDRDGTSREKDERRSSGDERRGRSDRSRASKTSSKSRRRRGSSRRRSPKAETPTIRFVSPSSGKSVRSRVTLKVDLRGFRLTRGVSRRLVPGYGYLHFSMDGGAFDMPGYSSYGWAAVKAGTQGRYSPASSTRISYSRLPKGTHTLTASLADNFHAEIGVSTSITIVVR